MSPAEAGRRIAADWPPLSDRQVEDAARILAGVARERAQEAVMTTKTPPIRQRCSQCRVMVAAGQLDDKNRCQSCAVQIELLTPEEVKTP